MAGDLSSHFAEDGPMFTPHCSACGGRVLLGPRRVIAIDTAADGSHRIDLRCHCGATLSEHVAGRARRRPAA